MEHVCNPDTAEPIAVACGYTHGIALFIERDCRGVVNLDYSVICRWVHKGELGRCSYGG